MSQVSLFQCENYSQKNIEKAVRNTFSALGGIKKFLPKRKKNPKVILKPNFLSQRSPESAVITHPQVIAEIAKIVLEAGATPIISESPGFVILSKSFLQKVGLEKVMEDLKLNFFPPERGKYIKLSLPNKKIKEIHFAKCFLEADLVINIPKIKTHMQTFYTGAIKNMFGGVAKKDRALAHSLGGYSSFSELLVDIYKQVAPQIHIMDAVIGMEGNGPNAGSPKKLGLILGSTDAVALDSVATYLIGFKPFEVLSVKFAHQAKIGIGELDEISIINSGKSLDYYKVNFKKPPTLMLSVSNMPWFSYVTDQLIKVEPFIDKDKCKVCGICKKVCPVNAIEYSGSRYINPAICIKCYCCHEMCPHKVIKIKKNFLAKIVEVIESR